MRHLLGRIEAAQLGGERLTQSESLRAFCEHEARHPRPHIRRRSVLRRLAILRPKRGRVEWLAELLPPNADASRERESAPEPKFAPNSVRSAPSGLGLSFVLAAALRGQSHPVDRDLRSANFATLPRVPASDEIDLPSERIETRLRADAIEEREFFAGRSFRDRSCEKCESVFGLNAREFRCHFCLQFATRHCVEDGFVPSFGDDIDSSPSLLHNLPNSSTIPKYPKRHAPLLAYLLAIRQRLRAVPLAAGLTRRDACACEDPFDRSWEAYDLYTAAVDLATTEHRQAELVNLRSILRGKILRRLQVASESRIVSVPT